MSHAKEFTRGESRGTLRLDLNFQAKCCWLWFFFGFALLVVVVALG